MSIARSSNAAGVRATLRPLLLRLHLYIGLFIAPFMLVAAFTGTAYVLTPQLENLVYHHALTAPTQGTARPLADQILAAQQALGTKALPSAVRPATAPGRTTRVMFTPQDAPASTSRAIFIAPDTLEVRGDLEVYGTSGILPLRTWLDQLHRSLLLGDTGRAYSELAASWLWVAALGGLILWITAPRRTSSGASSLRSRYRRWHQVLGGCLLLGLLFFSATGLTWSTWAGANIAEFRHAFGWSTPSASTTMTHTTMAREPDAHAEHRATGGSMPSMAGTAATFDLMLARARQTGLESPVIEIQAKPAGQAWKVREIDRRWPTHVDEATFDPLTGREVDHATFADYPLAAKLTRWGIDAHMGILFGLPNQLILAATGAGLCTMIILGYRMWWLRRATAAQVHGSLVGLMRDQSWTARLTITAGAIALGLALPVLGISLAIMLVLDMLVALLRHGSRRTAVN
ncbi:PepSY-associated TM helix domain-containing protein [Larsenimonas rhizosphaerae]|uniref:PepSY-associated TM helix domain-containing protein n=1 Tax=Larsenimonas rhizosphaerae TaxID=2944682 RepID=UPI0020345FD0|nr:PepSY-associated TM helix domain-containing protein [Larsenimonas rhizosphaerae]MCM2131914.1 PepSY domain-containing protein [Larsenimonas rhizosphaerae]